MKIVFQFSWLKKGAPVRRGFKVSGAYELVSEYAERIQKFSPCAMDGFTEKSPTASRSSAVLWVCDRGKGAVTLSSEQLAERLDRVLSGGARELHIVIGGADGFSEAGMARMAPDLRWSFGPMTLPHELAAVVAAEQMYRAWTILKGLPYHSGH